MFAAVLAMSLHLPKLAAGFPKYHEAVMPLACAALGGALTPPLFDRFLRYGSSKFATSAGVALTCLVGVDALVRHADLAVLSLWLALAALSLASAVAIGAKRAVGLAVGLLLGAQLTLGARHALSGAEGWSATYFYATGGQVDAASWLRQHATTGDVVIADREVAYYAADMHWIDSERLLFGSFDEVATIAGVPARPRFLITRHDAAAHHLPPGWTHTASFGAYQVWTAS